MAINTPDITTEETEPKELTTFDLCDLHPFGKNFIQVTRFTVESPIIIHRKRDNKAMELFKVKATYKYPRLDAQGQQMTNDRGYPDYLWFNIEQANFCRDGEENRAKWIELYSRLLIYTVFDKVSISFDECKATKREGQNGKIYYGAEITSPIEMHTDSPERVGKVYTQYMEAQAAKAALANQDASDTTPATDEHPF